MSSAGPAELRIGWALRRALSQGYGWHDFRADLMAGAVVGSVALPLSMALAIATGVPPQYGLYTAIVAGSIIALLGGSKYQVSGPTAAFVVILVPIVTQYGLAGLLTATLMAGILLALLGVFRMGRIIEFIPSPVTVGFTAGIAVVIASLQIKDFLGLAVEGTSDHFFERIVALARALSTVSPSDFAVGALTLALLIVWPRISRTIPAPLVALAAATTLAYAISAVWSEFNVATINTRFSYILDGVEVPGIPRIPPDPGLPWTFPGPNGDPFVFSLEMLRALMPSAIAIALLAGIESLLSAVVADGITGKRHDPDAELIALGIGNIVAPFFGGFAATGAIARTSTNIRSGARSPVASFLHAMFLLAAMVSLAPVLGFLPMASLAALLLVVAWNMSERKHFVHVVRTAPKSDVFVLLTCFGLTVVFDMVVAVTVGVTLAALLFMRRMVEVSGTQLVGEDHPDLKQPLPAGVVMYRIAGPLFFGAAQKAMSGIRQLGMNEDLHTVLLDLSDVPAIDATGLVNLESTLNSLRGANLRIFLAGVQPQPWRALKKAGIRPVPGSLEFCESLDEAFQTIWEGPIGD